MFNKDENKNDIADDKFKSVKIFTMKDDLNQGEVKSAVEKKIEEEPKKVENSLTENIRKSPFSNGYPAKNDLKPTAPEIPNIQNKVEEKKLPVTQAFNDPIPNSIENKVSHNKAPFEEPVFNKNFDYEKNNEPIPGLESLEEGGSGGSIFTYVVIFIVILLIGAGGYYLWAQNGTEAIKEILLIEDSKVINEGEENKPSEENIPIEDLSQGKDFSEKANFLTIKSSDLNEAGIRAVIEEKFKAMDSYSGKQLEFLPVNEENKPINLSDFLKAFNMKLPQETLDSLVLDNFSIFLYKNNNLKRINFVMATKEPLIVKNSLFKNEANLVKDLSNIFYEKPTNIGVVKFSDSEYKNNKIRYYNLNKNSDLSLDYSVNDNYLIIATSKDSGRLIVDKLSSEVQDGAKIFE